jgi:hypothetical protein
MKETLLLKLTERMIGMSKEHVKIDQVISMSTERQPEKEPPVPDNRRPEKEPPPVPPDEERPVPIDDPPSPAEHPPIDEGPKGPKKIV